MALSAVVGQAQALEGREAAAQATHKALAQLGRNPAVLGLVVASQFYPIQQVVSGVSALLGDTPLLGFSTSAEITAEGKNQRSVVVALLSGGDVQVQADWWASFSDDSRATAQKMGQALLLYQSSGSLLLVADGLNGDARQLCASLPPGNYAVAGCLAGGDMRHARTFQIGGRQSGAGGLAAALLTGKITLGIGMSHGWKQVGAYCRVTRARGPWIRELDGKPAAETYARLFGYTAREWAFPPLNELARLYPLGIELESKEGWMIRSPLRVETDGSLRLNTTVPEGSTGHLLVGSVASCTQAAVGAAQQALENLKKARPVLAIVLVDVAYQMLLEAQPGVEIAAICKTLGKDLPIIGGYTFGQLARGPTSGSPELFNQQVAVVALGEVKE
jgi:hypothetical protein